MNRTVGKAGAAVCGIAVFLFAASMIVSLFVKNGTFWSCFFSMFIAIGFVPFMCAVFAVSGKAEHRALGYAGLAFTAVYAVIILLVYYAECTTVRLNGALGKEVLSIISYGYPGSLFFNYDLLGYAFMALSTFLIGFTVTPRDKGDRALQWLLWIHGIFFISCLIMPMFPVFSASGSREGSGVMILEIWCAYFLPVCILGFRYFGRKEKL